MFCFSTCHVEKVPLIIEQATVLDARASRVNDLHSLCRIGMEYYLLNNDDKNIIY